VGIFEAAEGLDFKRFGRNGEELAVVEAFVVD
jgi:hypothetical protein